MFKGSKEESSTLVLAEIWRLPRKGLRKVSSREKE